MFRIDLSQNRLARLVQKRFSDLQLRERDHRQEWLANQPDALDGYAIRRPLQVHCVPSRDATERLLIVVEK